MGRAVGAGGRGEGARPSQILADQLTLFQPGRGRRPTTLLLAPPPPGFLDLLTALRGCPKSTIYLTR